MKGVPKRNGSGRGTRANRGRVGVAQQGKQGKVQIGGELCHTKLRRKATSGL